jgi:hypothetical protein
MSAGSAEGERNSGTEGDRGGEYSVDCHISP